MKTRLLERRKHLIAWTLSGVAWVAVLGYYLDAARLGCLPWQRHDGYPADVAALMALLLAVSGFVSSLPDDREDVSERSLWLRALWTLLPCILLLLLFANPLAWLR